MSTETTQEQPTVRTQLRTMSREEFVKAHSRAELDGFAADAGASAEDISSAANKGAVYDLIMANTRLPDPALRGKSTISHPVSHVWRRADEIWAGAGDPEAEGYTAPRPKDVKQAIEDEGVAFYTVRTQYQACRTATNAFTRRLADIDPAELPKNVREGLYPEINADDATGASTDES